MAKVVYSLRNSENNFSYKIINNNELVSIPLEQQMIVINSIKVDGELFVDGEVYIKEPEKPFPEINLPEDNFSYYNITTNLIKTIPLNQQMYVRDSIKVDGNLIVMGEFAVGNSYIEAEQKRLTNNVLSNTFYTVFLNEEYYFRNFLKIDGQVINNGFINIGV